MTKEGESAAWDLGLDPFFFSSLTVSSKEHAGSPASFGGVGTKSNTKPRSKGELILPITSPAWYKQNPNSQIYLFQQSDTSIQTFIYTITERIERVPERGNGIGWDDPRSIWAGFLLQPQLSPCWQTEFLFVGSMGSGEKSRHNSHSTERLQDRTDTLGGWVLTNRRNSWGLEAPQKIISQFDFFFIGSLSELN